MAEQKEIPLTVEQMMENEKREKVERFRHLNRFAKKGQTLFAGSSLMEQFPIHEILENHGMERKVYNRGIGGYTIPEMLDTMEEQIFALEPSVIFINIGTNDISRPDCTIEMLIENYEKVLRQIKERLPETKVYLMAYYPVNELAARTDWPGAKEMLDSRKSKLSGANQAVEQLAAKLGYHYIDVNQGLLDEENRLKREYTIDGIHMYADGYEAVFENLKKYL